MGRVALAGSPVTRRRGREKMLLMVAVLALAACGPDPRGTASGPATAEKVAAGCADVVAVEVKAGDDGTFGFSVTVSSADTGWEKYADAWEVRAPDGTVLAVRELAHPHVDEQPFTRSLFGVPVPPGIDRVTVAARDSVDGFCGETATVRLP